MKRYLFPWISISSMDVADPWVPCNTYVVFRELGRGQIHISVLDIRLSSLLHCRNTRIRMVMCKKDGLNL